ncbi:hypothetical protein BJ944DRAFT_93153 [Cunninghamella echinulata]|nr:hypothetical protein BJ944DRAFT_93153 [Cunninghamella echinulata]
MKDNHRFNQNDDSYFSKKEHVQQKLFTAQTSTATNHSHSHRHLVNKKSKKQLQQQRNRSPLGSKKQPHDSTKLLSSQQQEKESICVINTTEKNNSHDKNYSAYRDDWINVGEKKKKSVLSSTTYEKTNSNNMSNRILHHDHKKPGNMNKNHENNMEKNVFIEDDDADDVDDDKTIVDDDDIFISTDLSSNNTSDLELGSPNLSSTETIVSPDDSFTIKKMDQQPSSHLTTHIKHWYSPFSTGLKIDMLPKYDDPLTKLDPIQLRRNDLPSFTRSHHYDQDKFHLLQSHPFISHSNKLNQHSSSLGVIGQQQQYTSHVQNSSKSNLYSLFI